MKTVYVTRGSWAGRYLQLEDDAASAALSDGWARESETMTPEDEKAEADRQARNEPAPKSLADFEAKVSAGEDFKAGPETDAQKAGKKATAKAQPAPSPAPQPATNPASGGATNVNSTANKPSEEGDTDSNAKPSSGKSSA